MNVLSNMSWLKTVFILQLVLPLFPIVFLPSLPIAVGMKLSLLVSAFSSVSATPSRWMVGVALPKLLVSLTLLRPRILDPPDGFSFSTRKSLRGAPGQPHPLPEDHLLCLSLGIWVSVFPRRLRAVLAATASYSPVKDPCCPCSEWSHCIRS